MSKYNYFSVHDLKDIAMIYNDCDDYKIVVWNPVEQKEMTICFTGSDNEKKTVHFNVSYCDNYHDWKFKWILWKLNLKYKLKKLFRL